MKSYSEFINESQLNENMEWFELAKGLLAYDNLASIFNIGSEIGLIVGSIAAGYLITYVKGLRNERREKEVKEKVKEISIKLEKNSQFRSILNDIKITNYTDHPITKEERNENIKRITLLKSLIKLIRTILTEEELEFFEEIKEYIHDRDAKKILTESYK